MDKPEPRLTVPLTRIQVSAPTFSGVGAMPIDPSLERGVFEPEATAAMAKPLRLPARSFMVSASFKWCAKSLPDELLQRHAGVSLTRFAYERRRKLDCSNPNVGRSFALS